MFGLGRRRAGARGGAFGALLLSIALWLGAAPPASAVSVNCSSFPNATLDGFVDPTPPPDQISIDTNCTIRNYPGGLSTNFSFNNPGGAGGQNWLVIFDNVVHTGQMSCDAVHDNHIWFVNGSPRTSQPGWPNQLI